eukprot:GILI01021558.1.p1 GENE.GILI01021558.1~~GILI01021558.1.p1  ORF type:complete len:228 (-),score=14.65 GILI01021558.1:36-719(-)
MKLLIMCIAVLVTVLPSISMGSSCDFEYEGLSTTYQYLPVGLQSFSNSAAVNQTVNFELSACTAQNLSDACGIAYVGIIDGTHGCSTAFDTIIQQTVTANYLERVFNMSAPQAPYTGGSFTLRVYCDENASDDSLFTNSSIPSSYIVGNNYVTSKANYYAKSVCLGYTPPTQAPIPDDGGNSLQTGAIVGIVIGVVGVVVLASVIYQWRSKAKEDAAYSQLGTSNYN